MSEPTYVPLLNTIAVNEAKAEKLLQKWADYSTDAALKSVLEFVAIREGEHAWAFTKRLCELGFPVDETKAFQVFDDFDGLMACVASDASDAEKVAMLTGGNDRSNGEAAPDPFAGFFNDTTIDPQTGALLGRYIAEERDSGRRLQAEYDRVCATAETTDDVVALRGVIEELQAEVARLSKEVKAKKTTRKAAARASS